MLIKLYKHINLDHSFRCLSMPQANRVQGKEGNRSLRPAKHFTGLKADPEKAKKYPDPRHAGPPQPVNYSKQLESL
jgi:hypothetical protein